MKDIEKMIKDAITLIQKYITKGKTEIASEYNGYFVNLGVSIKQSGLAPALAFYSKETENTKENRTAVLTVLFHLLKKTYPKMITGNYSGEPSSFLLQYTLDILDKPIKYNNLKTRVIQGSIACKLALRTFEHKDMKQ